MQLPVRHRRSDYRDQLASFMAGPAPFLSIYLDVTGGRPRTEARARLLEALDRINHTCDRVLTPAQWTAAGDVLGLIEPDDASLVAFIDNGGRTLVTGYPTPPPEEVVVLSDVALLGPLLRQEQELVHHLIAVLERNSLTLLAVPRHGTPAHETIEVADRREAVNLVQRAARLSETALVVLCGPEEELPRLEDQVRAGLPIEVATASVAYDGLGADVLAKEVLRRVAERAEARTGEVLALWRFHHAHDLTVDGLDDTLTAVAEDRAALVVVADGTGEAGNPPSRLSELVVAAALEAGRPVQVVPAPDVELRDGVGVILTGRVDPDELARLIER